MMTGQTNVRSSRFGAGAIDGLGRELGRFIVTTVEVRRDDLAAALGNLRRYVESRRDLWSTVIQERELSARWIEEALATLRF